MDFFMKNILVLVCFFPLLGVLLIILWPKGKENETAVKWIYRYQFGHGPPKQRDQDCGHHWRCNSRVCRINRPGRGQS